MRFVELPMADGRTVYVRPEHAMIVDTHGGDDGAACLVVSEGESFRIVHPAHEVKLLLEEAGDEMERKIADNSVTFLTQLSQQMEALKTRVVALENQVGGA